MNSRIVSHLAAALALVTGGALVSAQGPLLPSSPKLGFGASVTPAYDGWYDNADGSHVYVIGYYNRNWTQEVDIPLGPNNHFEPGDPDRGQPTHFMPNRNTGMFTITMPKEFPPTERMWWVLTLNGVTSRVPFHRSPDYNFSPHTASEESPGGHYNKPAQLKFGPTEPWIQGPIATLSKAFSRTAAVNTPATIDLWVADDALFSSGTNATPTSTPPIVELVVNKYRGPGKVTVGKGHAKVETVKGGKLAEPFEGKSATTVAFDQPGDYVVHVTALDLSGPGGGATGCCWTTAMIKYAVK